MKFEPKKKWKSIEKTLQIPEILTFTLLVNYVMVKEERKIVKRFAIASDITTTLS